MLCEFLNLPPSRLDITAEDEAFLLHAMTKRNQRQEEASRQQGGGRGPVEEVSCG